MDRKEAARILDETPIRVLGITETATYLEALEMGVEALQEPERKRGQWQRYHKCEFGSEEWGHRCSECGHEISDDDSSIIKNFLLPNFCEHCGSDMRDTEAGPDFIDTGDW